MLSKSCEYGIRAVIYLSSLQQKGRKAGVAKVAEEIGSPSAFTAKVLQRLVHSGVLKSSKGPRGGFYLAKSAEEIFILDIVLAMDGPGILHNCILGFDKCSNTAPCPLHDQFIGVRDQLNTVLKSTTISEVVESYSKGDTILQLIQEK